MDLENLPYYFEELSAEDEEIVNNNFGEESSARGLGRYTGFKRYTILFSQ